MKSLSNPGRKHEILERLQNVRPDSVRRWGKMSSHQMICHLSDWFRGVMGKRTLEIAPQYHARRLLKWIVLYLPIPWPKGAPVRPELDQEVDGTAPSDFVSDRQSLQELIERFTRKPQTFQFRPHPIFLEISEREWMRWGYLHVDHHLRQFGL